MPVSHVPPPVPLTRSEPGPISIHSNTFEMDKGRPSAYPQAKHPLPTSLEERECGSDGEMTRANANLGDWCCCHPGQRRRFHDQRARYSRNSCRT